MSEIGKRGGKRAGELRLLKRQIEWPDEPRDFADALTWAREALGLTMLDLAQRSGVLLSVIREAAEEARGRLLAEVTKRQGYTVRDLLEGNRRYMIGTRGCKPDTAAHVLVGITNILPPDTAIASLRTEKVRGGYLALTRRTHRRTGKPLSVATHPVWLAYAKGWARWAVKEGLIDRNPVAAVEPIGRQSTGKLQLPVL